MNARVKINDHEWRSTHVNWKWIPFDRCECACEETFSGLSFRLPKVKNSQTADQSQQDKDSSIAVYCTRTPR